MAEANSWWQQAGEDTAWGGRGQYQGGKLGLETAHPEESNPGTEEGGWQVEWRPLIGEITGDDRLYPSGTRDAVDERFGLPGDRLPLNIQ